MSNVSITPIVGLSHSTGWSQVVEFSSKQNGIGVFVFAVSGDNAQVFGKKIIEDILFVKPSDAEGVYNHIADIEEKSHKEGVSISLAAGVFQGGQALLACLRASVLLNRDDKVGVVLASETEIKLRSGEYAETDYYIFLTEKARGFIPTLQKKLASREKFDSIVTSAVPEVHSVADSSLLALGFVSHKESEFTDEGKEAGGGHFLQKLLKIFGVIMFRLWFIVRLFFQMFVKAATVLFSREEYIGKSKSKRKLKLVFIFLLFVGLLIASVSIFSHKQKEEELAAEEFVSQFIGRRETIINSVDNDPISARSDLSLLIDEVSQIETTLDPETRSAERLQEELTLQKKLLEDISGRDEFSELEVYYDLRLVDSSFVANVVSSFDDTAVFVDTERKSVILLTISSKKATQIDVQQLPEIVDVVVSKSEVLFLTNQGVWRYDIQEKSLVEIIKEGDSNRAASFVQFFDPYVYVLNAEKRNIFRYAPSGDDFSEPIGWIVDKQGILFSDITSLNVDGDIWITTKDGEIKKLTSGEQVPFSIIGMNDTFSSELSLVTNSEIDSLIVLEMEKNRVVVLKKTGEFLREITSQSLQTVRTLFVNTDGTRAFAVSGSLVFSIEL